MRLTYLMSSLQPWGGMNRIRGVDLVPVLIDLVGKGQNSVRDFHQKTRSCVWEHRLAN